MKKQIRLELLFLVPSLVGLMIFYFIPFCDVVLRSFMSELGTDFVGVSHYKSVFTNRAFAIAAKNTLRFTAVFIPVLLLFSLLLALFMDFLRGGEKLYKKIFLLPMAIPVASLVLVFRVFFHEYGVINRIAGSFGVARTDYFHSSSAFWVLGILYIWRNFGYTMLLWQTGMDGIKQEMYEAAELDGAGYVKRFWYITLPQLKDMGFVIIVISILNSFKVFREAYLIAGDYPNQSIYMLQHLFNNWFVQLELGKLSAAAVLLSLVVILFVSLIKRMLISKEET